MTTPTFHLCQIRGRIFARSYNKNSIPKMPILANVPETSGLKPVGSVHANSAQHDMGKQDGMIKHLSHSEASTAMVSDVL